MARQTSPEQRKEFYRRHVWGETYAEIAEACEVSLECVRYWCRKQQKGFGVHSQYHLPLRGALSQFDPQVRQKVSDLREAHPRWGPISLFLNLEKEEGLQGLPLPHPSSIGRYLHSFPEYRRKGKKSGSGPLSTLPPTPINAGRSISR